MIRSIVFSRAGNESAASLSSRITLPGAALLLLAVLIPTYFADQALVPSNDTKGNMYLPVSLLLDGDLTFRPEEFPFMFYWELDLPGGPRKISLDGDSWSQGLGGVSCDELYQKKLLRPVGHRYYLFPSAVPGEFANLFGIGAGLASLPLYLPPFLLAPETLQNHGAVAGLARTAGAVFCILSAMLILLQVSSLSTPLVGLGFGLLYGLGTNALSIGSQGLWQHSPAEFFTILGLFAAGKPRRTFAVLSGFGFGAAFACRPTMVLFAAALGVYFLIFERRRLPWFVLGLAPVVGAIGLYNHLCLGDLLAFGQAQVPEGLVMMKTGQPGVWQTPLHVGLPGVLLSPSRGLFVFTPVFLLALPGLLLLWKRKEHWPLISASLASMGLILLAARHFDWWGGWSWGYRRLMDIEPIFILLLLPVWLSFRKSRWKRRVFLGLALASVGVQAVGAFTYNQVGWNDRTFFNLTCPGISQQIRTEDSAVLSTCLEVGGRIDSRENLNIDLPPNHHRLWSLSDSQIVYYLTHLPEARGERLRLIELWLSRPDA